MKVMRNITSMTGYGAWHFSTEHLESHVRVRTVNGRFLEIRFHLPKEYLAFESELRKMTTSYIQRGSVDIHIQRKKINPSNSLCFVASPQLAKSWLKACQYLSEELGIEVGEITVKDMVGIVDVIHYDGSLTSAVDSEEKKLLFLATQRALENCQKEREREGQALKTELLEQQKHLSHLIKSMDDLHEEANRGLKKKFDEKFSQLTAFYEKGLDPQRLAQEVALHIEKTDINEELWRLREHIKNFREILNNSGVFGKKLDFYAQELLRETNTIGSKSQLTQLTHLVVDAKTVIEKMREQVQNIE